MSVLQFQLALGWAMGFGFVTAGLAAGLPPVNSNLQIRNAPGRSSADTLLALRQTLSSAAILERDTPFVGSTSLDTSWEDLVLFTYEKEVERGNASVFTKVEIVCATCYIKGTATAQFTIDENFDFSQAFNNITTEIEAEFNNLTTVAKDYTADYYDNLVTTDDVGLDDLEFPPIDIDLDLDFPDIPECALRFQFDDLELYMQIDTSLSAGASYTFNLYTSRTPIGFTVGEGLTVGIIFTVDLILSVETGIDISSGFHIQLNDGIAIDISMFSKNVSSITFNGGNFEFLPVTIESSGIVVTAVLRIGAKASLELGTGDISIQALAFSTGLEAGVWVDVAQFTTTVQADEDINCELRVTEEYALLLGANAGASVAVRDHTWGPMPETQVPIWYTTLMDTCAMTGSATVTASAVNTVATITARDELSTATSTDEVTYTAVACISTGLINCPVSLQTTLKNTVTRTLEVIVSSGSEAVFPTTTQNTIVSAIAFRSNSHEISQFSGSPVSFVPPPPTATASSVITSVLDGDTHGVSNKLIIGVSVGVGVPVLLAIIVGSIFCIRRKRCAAVQTQPPYVSQQDLQTSEPYTPVFQKQPTYVDQHDLPPPEPYTPEHQIARKKVPNVTVAEQQSRS